MTFLPGPGDHRDMNRSLGAGLVLSAVGFVGYAVGVWMVYPARSFSVTALMVGITLAAIGRSLDGGADPDADAGPDAGREGSA